MKLNYTKDAPLTLPRECLTVLADADAADLRVLLYISACEANGNTFDISSAAEELQLQESEVRSSLKFWRGAGVVKVASKATGAKAKNTDENSKPEKQPREKHRIRYTTDELSTLGETNQDFKTLLDMAQQTAGWIFNQGEIEILAVLFKGLRLSEEYILALLNYFVCRREKSLRYVETAAYGFVDEGIDTAEKLEERLRYLERYEGREGHIRSLFGIGGRALTKKEKECLTAWFDTYAFNDDVIRLAYEKTVGNTGKASIHYANSILKTWHEAGCKTLADVQSNIEKNGSKPKSNPAGNKSSIATQSFDVHDAFQKALERSYSEEKK